MPLAVELLLQSSLAQVAAAILPRLALPLELLYTAQDLRFAWSTSDFYVREQPHD